MVRRESEALSGNKRSQTPWQITLGPLQALIVFGVAFGCIMGAYYLGFFSGKKTGFETARVASRAEVAKMPVPEDFTEQQEPDLSQVYSQLSDAHIEKSKSLPSEPPQQIEKSATAEKDPDSGKKTLGQLLDQRVQEVRATVTPTAKALATVVSTPTVEATSTVPAKATSKAPPPTATPKQAATKTPAKAPPTAVSETKTSQQGDLRQVIPEGWFAQVAAPKKMSEAQDVANKLKKAGFKVVIENANVRGETFYRIIVGPEQNRVQAERLVEQLSRESVVSGKPFVRRVR